MTYSFYFNIYVFPIFSYAVNHLPGNVHFINLIHVKFPIISNYNENKLAYKFDELSIENAKQLKL